MAAWTTAILDEMARHREQFKAFCRSLSPEEMSERVPGSPWTVQDYIAHLCTIDGLLCRFFGPAVAIMDMPPLDVAPPTPFDIDEWNEAAVEKRCGASLEELFDEAVRHRATYIRILEALPEGQMGMMIPFGGDRKVIDLPATTVRLEDLLWSIALHDPNHTRDILRALPNREPELREWIASADFERVPAAITDRRV
jgi:DinB superfamily